jgi:glycosidase
MRLRPAVPNACLLNEFHVSRAARDRCAFDELLFASSGRAVLARPAAAHRFAAALNSARGGSPTASAADLFALGLLDEAAHLVIAHWRRHHDPNGTRAALEHLEQTLGSATVDRLLLAFVDAFPTVAVYRGRLRAAVWLGGATDACSHREIALEELLLLALTHANPASQPYRDLFDDALLRREPSYAAALRELEAFFALRPRVGASGVSLLDFLRGPMRAAPASLAEQLAFVRGAWGFIVGDLVERMDLAFDLRREEEAWLTARAAGTRGEHAARHDATAPDYQGSEHEEERFSTDTEWMPRTVMIAKSTLVWLGQLSKTYAREVSRLDQVPEEELDRLAALGITALWLIGVWERSAASRRIKQIAGNPDAAASAYAVHDYRIADELGGEEAWLGLSQRAGARGIRLASDMVPNHVGLDSRWVIEHPEWFLSRYDSPYPAYSFDGAELSNDDRVSLKIEDHYWDKSDAAVVFRRVDNASGDTRFIYHGNDGTSFPWNDTAQLDYLNPAAREAVIQAILGVARRFPIIRFDAAMTLAKKHIQRLWFPEPGSGGAIPSRAGLGVTRVQFDRLLPQEFWREVVDRVAVEAPGTLLLAEAFWLMEGYFVRTLGMHRVYNSAFMVMLRDERNADYRSVLRNTLEFDPDILQRWVNFLNNPDERTAVDQFGRGEKYFGVCTLMATMPGLPMFGHGQIEGYEERYGMEFRRALRDEPVDQGLEREHWRRLVPLLHRRELFSGAREFLLYDCRDHTGHVNENVFAYSNRGAGGASLVLYHNRYAEAHGSIRASAAYAEKHVNGSRTLRQRSLIDGLAFAHLGDDRLLRCREQVSGHEFLFRVDALRERGMRVDLGGYQSRVFIDWQAVMPDLRPWDELERTLGGHGVQDLEAALWKLATAPVRRVFTEALAAPSLRSEAETLLARLLPECSRLLTLPAVDAVDAAMTAKQLRERLTVWAALLPTAAKTTPPDPEHLSAVAWLLIESLATAYEPVRTQAMGVRLYDELGLRDVVAEAARAHGADGEYSWRLAARTRALLAHPEATASPGAWALVVADADALWAAGLTPTSQITEAPAWLRLPLELAARPGKHRSS